MSYLFRGRSQQNPRAGKDGTVTQQLPETTWNTESLPSGIPPQGKVVVTISRQFGSGGAEVGRILARESGLLYVDHEIIGEVARRLGINEEQAAQQDEQTVGAVGHILEALQSSTPFNVNYRALLNPAQAQAQAREVAYFRLTQRVILELATEGNAVIIGRGSQFLLHALPRTLHVYIFAPLGYRIEQAMQRYQLDRVKAKELVERRDYEHEAYLGRYYGASQHQPYLYHLLINTSLFTNELAANLIRQALPIVTTPDA